MLRTMGWVAALALAGCGGETTSSDAGTDSGTTAPDAGGTDAGTGADAGTDAGMGTDAGIADAGMGTDAGTGTDAGSGGCPAPIEDMRAGVCDGRGMILCTMWAQKHGGPGATAQCTPPDGRCARASECSSAGCTCGGAPECADDRMCVRTGVGFACECIR